MFLLKPMVRLFPLMEISSCSQSFIQTPREVWPDLILLQAEFSHSSHKPDCISAVTFL